MNKLKELLRLHFDCKLSQRQIGNCLGISHSRVSELLSRFKNSGLSWPLQGTDHENKITEALFKRRKSYRDKALPDYAYCFKELKHPSMTKMLLWEEYSAEYGEQAYGYTQFSQLYRRWLQRQKRSMRQSHKAAEKLFIDFCGPTIPIINPQTGEITQSQIFVATLGASNYTYVEACQSQALEPFLTAHVNCFNHFGGVPHILVPDNLKSAVTKADKYEPTLNEQYQKLARHYGCAVFPARPYKPKDKAKAENAVLIVERWIMMRLRQRTFHSLAELNQAISVLMNDLNQREMRQIGSTRLELFNQLDKPSLLTLPSHPYQYTDIKRLKVAPDYHVQYKHQFYSVPHVLVGEYIELEATQKLISVYHKGNLITQHPRRFDRYGHSTKHAHMPSNHQYQAWDSERFLKWASNIGSATHQVIDILLKSRKHPEQAYRSCFGLLGLVKKHSQERLEQACQDALLCNQARLSFIKSLLNNHREGTLSNQPQDVLTPEHSNIRGSDHYH